MSQDANDLIMGGGAPPAKFAQLGALNRGKITDLATSQQRDPKTKQPKVWQDGNPMMQAIITLQTAERDPNITNDDGKRRLFVASKSMREAIRNAVQAAGQRELAIGGDLAVQYTSDGVSEGPGLSPPKLYAAEYAPPAMGIGMLGGQQVDQPVSVQTPPPAQAPAAGRSLLG